MRRFVLCSLAAASLVFFSGSFIYAEEKSDFDKQFEQELKALQSAPQDAPADSDSDALMGYGTQPLEETQLGSDSESEPSSQPASAMVPADEALPSTAENPPAQHRAVITDIEVRGNNIVGTNTILSKIKSQKGAELVQAAVNEDIKRLYGTGFFEDIKIEVNENPGGYTLMIVVIEKPVIKTITVTGNKSFQADKIRKELKILEGQILDRKAVKQGVEAIRKMYADKGFKFIDVNSEVNVDRITNETAVTIRINEGEKYKIQKIQFDGNAAFAENRLLKLMKTKARQPWMFRSGVFKSENFDEDMERLQLFYQKEGYLDVKMVPDFQYDDKAQSIVIVIRVEEGPHYVCGDVKIKGNRVFPESEIWQELGMLPGQTYSQYYLSQDVEKVRDYYFSRGYMDVRILPDIQLNKTTSKVDVFYTIEEGDIYFVDKVVVRGNTKTRDIVIRRELRIRPGEKFDGEQIKKSKQRLENLGYFEEVTYDTEPSESGTNRKDLIFRVKEKRTGELSFGGGISSVDNLVGFAQISQKNFDITNWPRFTGGGQSLSLAGRFGTINQHYNLSFYEPYLFNKPVAYGLDVFKNSLDDKNVDFEEDRMGVTNTISKLFKDVYRLGTGYTLERVKLDDIAADAPEIITRSSGSNMLSRWKIFNSFDTRDNVFNPTKGLFLSLSMELVGSFLGGDESFFVTEFSGTHFWTFFKKQMLESRIRLANSKGFGDTDEVPVYDRFFAGGLGTVRGFGYRRVGPKENGNSIGGETMMILNLDYSFQIPRLDFMRGVVFVDVGQINRDSFDFYKFGDAVLSTGPGVKIKTPLGPVALYYGFPLFNEDEKNRNGRFEFSLSRGF